MTANALDMAPDQQHRDIEVVAVIEHEAEQSHLADSMVDAFANAGLTLLLRTPRELVDEVNVSQALGVRPRVEPDRCLLLLTPGFRSPSWPGQNARFIAAETAAAARCIAMYTAAPVLNRPSDRSNVGLLPLSRVLAVRQVRHAGANNVAIRPEHFSTESGSITASSDPDLEVYDYSGPRTSYRIPSHPPADSPPGPFRFRAAARSARELRVTLIGEQILATGPVATRTVAATRQIAAYYQLDLVTLWWLVADRPDFDGVPTLDLLSRISVTAADAAATSTGTAMAQALAQWAVLRVSRMPASGVL